MLIITMLFLNQSARSANIFVVCITQLPGVILHELAHFLTGTLLRAEPGSFNLIPQRRLDGRWTLGSVAFRRVTAFNAVPIALAPLGLLPIAFLVYQSWFDWLPLTITNTLILYVTIFLLIYNSLPSRQDIRIACNFKSLLLYGSAGVIVGYYWLKY